MLTCRVKPHYSDCRNCLEMQVDQGVVAMCNTCPYYKDNVYDVITVGKEYVVIINDKAEFERVSFDRVYDVKAAEF